MSDTMISEGVKSSTYQYDYPVLSRAQAIMLTLSVTLAMVLNIMQTQAIILALERIGVDLDIPIVNYQWLSSSYSLAFGSLLLLFGRIADIYGHKRVFLAGSAWMCIWSIACGFAPNQISIAIFRAMQGVGTGAFIPAALGILAHSFPPSQAKSTAFSTFSGGAPIGGSLGAVIGGILTQYSSWRSIFYVSAGISALVFTGGWLYVPDDRPKPSNFDRSIDWLGGALVTGGLCLVIFALGDGSSAPKGWRTPYIPVLFALGIGLLVVFWSWERHVEYNTSSVPLMRTSLWFKGHFAIVQLIGALGWSSFASFMFFATLYFQSYQLLTPVHATVRFLPACITGVFLNIIVAVLASRVPAQIMILLGGLGTGAAPLLYALQKSTDPYWKWQFPGMILCVFGADFIFACGILYVSKVAGPDEQSLAGGIFNAMTAIGTAFGLAIMTIIQSKSVQQEVERLGGVYDPNSAVLPPSAVLKGLTNAFYGCAGFGFATAVITATCLHGSGYVGHKAEKVTDAEAESEKINPPLKKGPSQN